MITDIPDKKLLDIFRKYQTPFALTIVYIFGSSYFFEQLQKNIYCQGIEICQFWGGSSGFLLANISLGWIFCLHLYHIFTGSKQSQLLKILFPIATLLYLFLIYYFFGYYSLIIDRHTLYFQSNSFASSQRIKISTIKSIYFTNHQSTEGGYFQKYYAVLYDGNRMVIPEQSVNYLIEKSKLPVGL